MKLVKVESSELAREARPGELAREELPRPTQQEYTDPNAPVVGRWYWVSKNEDEDEESERWFGCVTRIGTNYAYVSNIEEGGVRIHLSEFPERCTHEPNAQRYIAENIASHQRETMRLMQKVQDITHQLGISMGAKALEPGSETQALALRSATAHEDTEKYKKALTKAKEKTLPELFKQIEESNRLTGKWMKAELLPLKAEAKKMEKSIEKIESRIFNVELYAGLTEQVKQLRSGKPAAAGEPIWLFQRRHYMDEECLANYRHGGMTFKNLPAFDRWLLRKENLERILPKPRCIVAFRVRRHDRDTRGMNLHEYISLLFSGELDQDRLTFLYIRNGARVYRLNTTVKFGFGNDLQGKLFPDLDHAHLTGRLYATDGGWGWDRDSDHVKIIPEGEYLALRREVAQQIWKHRRDTRVCRELLKDPTNHDDTRADGKPWLKYDVLEKIGRTDWWHRGFDGPDLRPHHLAEAVHKFKPFDRENLNYDEIAARLKDRMDAHNRLVLVLQGLLDRSPCLHPHPPYQLWTEAGFNAALRLVYDDSRALAPTENPPDFDAYRRRLNSTLKVGDITIGQHGIWLRIEAERENARRRSSWRYRGSDTDLSKFAPYGNPGPGRLARVVKLSRDGKKATFEWQRERMRLKWYHNNRDTLRCRLTVDVDRLLNVSAYKPGDFRQFYADPRTRANYFRWAKFLLEAEEYWAGNRKVGVGRGEDDEPMPASAPEMLGGADSEGGGEDSDDGDVDD